MFVRFDVIEVENLESANADGGKLEGNLPSHRSHADHGRHEVLEFLLRHQIGLPRETIVGFGIRHWNL